MYYRQLKLLLPLLLVQLLIITQTVHCRPDLWKTITGAISSPEVSDDDVATCGYKSCPKTKTDKLNVHIIAHTHDDVGWLKTVDQYFYGTRKDIQSVGVQYILDSVVPQLLMDKSKRFIYVEMSFFVKWWQDQDDQMKTLVKQLVNEGRLEFINGGWCMNDEATVTYHSTIEQMTLGLKFLNETFGPCGHPKVGWQIDPFGHSNEQASLFAQFGFDGMFFTRISYLDKLHRTQNKSLDLIWHGDRALPGQSGSIFTNIFRDGYDAPDGYCFDAFCKDDSIVDNKRSYEYNVEDKGNYMISFIRNYATSKLTNHLLIPFGGDFQFSAAGQNFKSLDKMMRYIREHAPDINIFYSTPSCYQYSVYEALKNQKRTVSLPEKYNDFMPYDSSHTVWWSGYFTSRPSMKLVEREVANLLQVARMISLSTLLKLLKPTAPPDSESLSTMESDWIKTVELHESECLRPLWEILGDLQHHDAITGTEKQHVTDDYVRRAVDAINLCANFIGDLKRHQLDKSLGKSIKLEETGKQFHLDSVYLERTSFCMLLNISQCDALNSDADAQRVVPVKMRSMSESSSTSHSIPQKNAHTPQVLATKGTLMTVYNPLAKALDQVDIRLPCKGSCDLSRIKVIQLATKETMELDRLPVPAGIGVLPFRNTFSNYEILFYVDVPALGSRSFVINDENDDTIIYESPPDESGQSATDSASKQDQSHIRRFRQASGVAGHYENFYMKLNNVDSNDIKHQQSAAKRRLPRDSNGSSRPQQNPSDQVAVKLDMHSGVIVGLRRKGDKNMLNVTQKFGYYYPARHAKRPGAYIFRPNSSEPILFDKPISFKIHKRRNNTLIEIHQKWADWVWQTIRLDAKKNYIEFDYVVGPIPEVDGDGLEVITRYETSMSNDGVFFTDSNARQMLPRHRLKSELATQLGGSFFPVVSTIMIQDNKPNKAADALAMLVDRPQAGTSLNEGDIELLIHRRLLSDDYFGVGEALNEPGEDGRGLVIRGKHRLFLKFQSSEPEQLDQAKSSENQTKKPTMIQLNETPNKNLVYEQNYARIYLNQSIDSKLTQTYLINDQLFNEIRQETIKYALKPMLTFDKMRVSANEFMHMFDSDNYAHKSKSGISLLNSTLPSNIHLLTLQPWNRGLNQLLIRLENLDNPLVLHPLPDQEVYKSLLNSYESVSRQVSQKEPCSSESLLQTQVDIEYLIKDIRIVNVSELNLGANARLADDSRINWTNEPTTSSCKSSETTTNTPTNIKLGPRQIRTLLVNFVFL